MLMFESYSKCNGTSSKALKAWINAVYELINKRVQSASKILDKDQPDGEVLCIKGMQVQQVSMWTINLGWSGPRTSAAQRKPSLLALMEEEVVTKVMK